jgi:hypothetical protein
MRGCLKTIIIENLQTKMAYSIIYRKNTNYDDIKGPLSTVSESPFMDWYKNKNKKTIIFSYDTHGMGNSDHTSFFPDSDGNAGYIYHFCNGAYVEYHIYIRVLIDVKNKKLYFSDLIINYENYFWGCEKRIKNGNYKAFNKLLKGHLKNVGKYMLNKTKEKFFGKGWYYHYRYTEKHKKLIEKRMELLKGVRGYMNLPVDIQQMIKDKTLPWPEATQTKITQVFIDNVQAICEKYIGAKCLPPNDLGRYYAWGRVIGVFPEEKCKLFE